MDKKIGQVWIETVLYTIIGLAIIGIVLGFAMPKISQSKDNIIIEQSITAIKNLDSQIREVARSSGSLRRPEFSLKRGYLDINASSDKISLIISDLSNLYSENNVSFNDGDVKIISLKGSKKNTVILSIQYPYNITYDGIDQDKLIPAAGLPYKLNIYNNNQVIDLKMG